jgi:hypothetical protein
MGISKGRANPLNVLSMRRLNRIPPNFTKIQLKNFFEMKELDNWIYLNLDSRYCVRKASIVDDNKLTTAVEVGIEDAKEVSMLTLACPLLHKIRK